MAIRNKEEGNSISSRLSYIAKQLSDPSKTGKEIKVLKLREENLLKMLDDDQETFKDGGTKKFRHPAGVAIRKGLDRKRYLRSDQGKAEKKAREEHNAKFGPTDKKTKRKLRKDAKKSDAAKGKTMRERGSSNYYEEMKDGGMNDVPSKYKGFSNLPEGVQEKIDPNLAKKYKTGGMSKAVLKARGGTFKGTF
jgi:hypothetical protein